MPLDHVRPWDELDDDEKKLFARFAEVYAGFSEYTDAQVGRIIDYLEETGQLENTIVMYCADNGASGEGSPDGTVNENKFFNALARRHGREPRDARQARVARTPTTTTRPGGRPRSRRRSRCSSATPTRAASPTRSSSPGRRAIDARGEMRTQYHHAVDIVPTILECIGLEMPEQVQGYAQSPLPGVSMKYSFDADGPTEKKIQYYEMFGTRALWHDGWHVVAQRAPQQGATAADFVNETWELYHSDEDRAELHDLAAEHPEKVKELVNLWYVEAGKYDVLPLDNRSMEDLIKLMPVAEVPEGGIYRYYPQTSPVPEFAAAEIRGRSFKILADVELTDDSVGVLIANGARFGGHSLFIKERRLWYVSNFLGIAPEQVLTSPDELTAGSHVLGVEFAKESHGERRRGPRHGDPLRRRLGGGEERLEDPARPFRPVRRGTDSGT